MKLVVSMALALLCTSAYASLQEIEAMDSFCQGEIREVLDIQRRLLAGEKSTEEMYEPLLRPTSSAIIEKMLRDLMVDLRVDQEVFVRRNYAMCMDNARRVLLNAKQGRHTKLEELR